ncbi:dicarboxylate/amino acid:cation symporter [Clostridium tagluense]|uniref:dicarboxylate/amino acid:cation symporter n=1 Tax=Clostridium tagluense TaxID=360422 RepID=UPI001CF24A6D|nr:dicarboxylate/amino acid:cation symporter [Clostridium tagluense]MCB2312583.1 dicarboxylate/amino acid:cation symporter [Clostridium tagluense]MCB2317259.1 dicarboxylate/amino acid:cation symporter [Clostridium tagluense]MCB2322124.1 dicarboxylate/amino acid:cation symporter [Clostridium tagluense]MCB2327055.1 dicarboxylate/amino acid:cation symporter [Clostridium tagluense]MCB2331773.1 dicarboxylate/amino acid:cation symporter [Clostridium tagluense]
MKNFLKNYKMSLVLLLSILLGGIIGIILGPKATVLEPFGQIFLNLMFTIIVPLVFFSITSAIANMTGMNRLGKIMINIAIVFVITALMSGILAIVGALIFNPTKGLDAEAIKTILSKVGGEIGTEAGKVSLSQRLVSTVTVGDFSGLFSKNNMLQIIIFSVLFGVSTALVGEKATVVKNLLNAATTIMMKMVSIIMYYAPIGLGCYFASVVGQLGTQILQGYLKVFLLYLGLTAINYFVVFSIYSYLSAGKMGFRAFWKNAISPTVIALATCSSAASIPVNLEATKKIGVPKDIAETVIPLGVNTHKDGSVMGGVLKIVFVFGLFGKEINSIPMILSILAVSFLVGAVMGAIPGGGMIGEMLIISVYGFPPEALPIIVVISTIIDAPATVLNSTGNTVCAMMVSRLVDGKKWLNVS